MRAGLAVRRARHRDGALRSMPPASPARLRRRRDPWRRRAWRATAIRAGSRKPLRLPLGAVERDALAEHSRRGVLVEDQVEAALRRRGGSRPRCRPRPRTADAAAATAAARPRCRRTARISAVREALARHERLGHHLDRFLEARLGLLRRDAEAGELVVPVALADAEIEPAAGNRGRASPPARPAAPDCARAARSRRCRAAAWWCAWPARSAASASRRPGSSR